MEHLNNQPLVATPAKSLWQYFVEAYTQNYFNFKGRARRREYWGIWLFNNLIAWAIYIALEITVIGHLLSDADAGAFSMLSSMNLTWIVISVLWSIVGFFPQASATVRRLHDKGYSGKWYLGAFFLRLVLVPLSFVLCLFLLLSQGVLSQDDENFLLVLFGLIGLLFILLAIFIFILLLLDGDKTENKYGPSPKYMPIDEYVAGNSPL